MRWILIIFTVFLIAAAPVPAPKSPCDTAAPLGNIALDTLCLKAPGLPRKQRANLYFNRAFDYLEARQVEKGLADYDVAIGLEPRIAQYYYERATAKVALGRFKPAIDDLAEAMALAPASKDISAYYVVRSEAYDGLKDHNRACADYSKALKLNRPVAEWVAAHQAIDAKPPQCH